MSHWPCTRCGSPNGAAQHACSVCGQPNQAAAWPSAHGFQAHGHGAAQGGHNLAAGAAQAWPRSGPAHPPVQGMHAPSAKSGAFPWGCGIAGCLGALVLLALTAGGIFWLSANSSSGGKGKSRPTRGSLRNRMPKRVGSWTLISVKAMNVASANEAFMASYSNGHAKLAVGLSAFSSTASANAHLQAMSSSLRKSAGGATEKRITIRGTNGDKTGDGRSWASNPERFAYRKGRMTGLMVGPPGQIKPFFQNF